MNKPIIELPFAGFLTDSRNKLNSGDMGLILDLYFEARIQTKTQLIIAVSHSQGFQQVFNELIHVNHDYLTDDSTIYVINL